MKLVRIAICLTLGVVASACTPSTSIRHSSDFASKLSTEQGIGVLPAKANVSTSDIGGKSERMYDYEEFIQPIVQEAIQDALTNKGYRTSHIRIKDLRENHLYRDVDRIREDYDDRAKTLWTKYSGQSNEAFNIDERVSQKSVDAVRKQTSQNILVLPTYMEVSKTSGARARDFAMDVLLGTNAGANAEFSSMKMAFIDSKDGSILWSYGVTDVSNLYGAAFDNIGDPVNVAKKKVADLTALLMKSFPDKDKIFEAKEEEEKMFSD